MNRQREDTLTLCVNYRALRVPSLNFSLNTVIDANLDIPFYNYQHFFINFFFVDKNINIFLLISTNLESPSQDVDGKKGMTKNRLAFVAPPILCRAGSSPREPRATAVLCLSKLNLVSVIGAGREFLYKSISSRCDRMDLISRDV